MLAISMLPSIALAAERPANDEITGAQAISSLPFKQRINIKGATVTDDEPECRRASRSVWYAVTPAAAGRITVQLRRSDFSYNLSVWQGTPDALSSAPNPIANAPRIAFPLPGSRPSSVLFWIV